MGSSSSKSKKSNSKEEKLEPIQEESLNVDNNDQPIENWEEEGKQVGYIIDMSETEREWKEKEEQKESIPEKKRKCLKCSNFFETKEVYPLETCGHRFCFPCIYGFLEKFEAKDELPTCPCDMCEVPISLGDLKKAINIFGAEEPKEEPLNPELSVLRESVGIFDNKLTHSLEFFIESFENFAKCPKCKVMFERVPLEVGDPRKKETVLDDKGVPVKGMELEHYLEQRFRCFNCTTIFCAQCQTVPYHLGKTCRQYLDSLYKKKCRYCAEIVSDSTLIFNMDVAQGNWVKRWKESREEKRAQRAHIPNIQNKEVLDEFIRNRERELEAKGHFYICREEECNSRAVNSCKAVLPCGHLCGGVDREEKHLPCLKEDELGEDYCNICWTEDLNSAPTLQLTSCGHMFHYHCIKTRIDGGYSTPYITFQFANCPLCNVPIQSSVLNIAPIRLLEAQVRDLGVRRLRAELLMDDPELQEGGEYHGREADYALLRFAFYQCFRCKKPYFGGQKVCEAGNEEANRKFDPKDLICPGCRGLNGNCPSHGQDYIEYKCRFCCSLATFFCGGKTHFCTPCHDIAGQKVDFVDWSTKWEGVEECKGANCPLGGVHAPNGEEYSLGCAMCNASA